MDESLNRAISDFKQKMRDFSQDGAYGSITLTAEVSGGVVNLIRVGETKNHKVQQKSHAGR